VPGANGCNANDLKGDFDQSGFPSLGDAVFVAHKRLEYGITHINPISCVGGDFDSDGSFTINDASRVAEAQFNKYFLPWQKSSWEARHLLAQTKDSSGWGRLNMTATRLRNGKLQMGVHVQLDEQSSPSDANGKWKALGVQFVGGKIDSVVIHRGEPGQITAQWRDNFFQAVELGGAGMLWPSGHVSTVTFAEGTNMSAVHIDYKSFNTYVVATT
jgi:hypothetical protein